MICPEANRGGRGKTIPELEGFAPSRISEARVVPKHTPDATALQGSKPLANAVAEARSVRDSNRSYDEKFKDFQHAEPTLANRVIYGEVSLLEAQKLAEENAARLDRLGWWNVLQTMEPYTRLFADNLLAKLDKALTEHPDECPLEDMKRFAIEYRDGAARLAAVLLAHAKI
jgi:hypothetical protein